MQGSFWVCCKIPGASNSLFLNCWMVSKPFFISLIFTSSKKISLFDDSSGVILMCFQLPKLPEIPLSWPVKMILTFWTNEPLSEKCPNAEFFLVYISRIQSECGKMQTRKNSVFGYFPHNETLTFKWLIKVTRFSYTIKMTYLKC